MKTLALLALATSLASGIALADKNADEASGSKPGHRSEARAEADSLATLKQGVQLTEVGNLRAVFVFAEGAQDAESRVTEAFSNADFRVFPSPVVVADRIKPKELQKIGDERYADLVVYTTLDSVEKPQLGSLHRYEVTAAVQVYNPMSEELMASTTIRSSDEARARKVTLSHADADEALHLATNIALDAAIKQTIVKTLEKAHKLLVHEAELKGVLDHEHLLEIINYTAKLAGVYHVRQISYDKPSGLAVIEIIGAPQTESYWRAYLNNLPKHEILLQKGHEPRVIINQELRKKHGIDFDKLDK